MSQIYPKIVKDKNRVSVIANNRNIFNNFIEGHRYEIKIPNHPAFTAVLAMYWTGGHRTAQFIIDNGGGIELQEIHLIDYVKHMGEVTEALDSVKDRILTACNRFVSEVNRAYRRFGSTSDIAVSFTKSDIFGECGIHYCAQEVFNPAWNALLSEGKFACVGTRQESGRTVDTYTLKN